jgi:hypothetical protein
MQVLERINFWNGEPLNAADWKTEQGYHMSVQRLLMQGLFSPGVVNGLEVGKKDAQTVTVSPGLALDARGREIFLADETELIVPNHQPSTPGLGGYFLVIRYAEQAVAGASLACTIPSSSTPANRIREQPQLYWSETRPNPSLCAAGNVDSACGIVLAKVLLDASCQVAGIESRVRQWAHPLQPCPARALAFEGERDIDNQNPKVLHFQVRGRPDSIELYLWGAEFTSFYYTELGHHAHLLTAATTDSKAVDLNAHTHPLAPGSVSEAGSHSHEIFKGGTADNDYAIDTNNADHGQLFHCANLPNFIVPDGQHTHPLSGVSGGPTPTLSKTHSHHLLGATDSSGAAARAEGLPYLANAGPALTYVDDLRVKLDGVDITAQINASLGWPKLGDGTSGSLLVTNGTGSIDLIQLGLPMEEGPHSLEFLVFAGGGRIIYNLYIE